MKDNDSLKARTALVARVAKQAIEEAGSIYRLWKATGLSKPTIGKARDGGAVRAATLAALMLFLKKTPKEKEEIRTTDRRLGPRAKKSMGTT